MTLIVTGNDRPPVAVVPVRGEPRLAAPFGDVLGTRAGRPDVAAGGFLGDAALGGDQFATSARADVFNAEGFFQGPTATPPDGQSIAATMLNPIQPTEVAQPIAVDNAKGVTSSASPRALGSGTADLVPHVAGIATHIENRPTSMNASSHANTTPRPSIVASPVTTGQNAADRPSPADFAIGAGRRLFARLLTQRGAALATRVAVAAVEQGIRISISVDRLDRDERARLRDRVAALLSRHGLAAHDIRLTGGGGDASVSRAKEQ